MKFKIHWKLDSIIIEEETAEECHLKAECECAKHGWILDNCWIEEVKEQP